MGTLAIEPRSLESHERNVGLTDQARLNALRRASEKHFVVAFLQNLSQRKSGVDVAGRSAARKNKFHREFLPLPRHWRRAPFQNHGVATPASQRSISLWATRLRSVSRCAAARSHKAAKRVAMRVPRTSRGHPRRAPIQTKRSVNALAVRLPREYSSGSLHVARRSRDAA